MTHIICTRLKSLNSLIVPFLCVLLCAGCSKSKRVDDEVKTLIGKEVLLPQDFKTKETMIIHYVDSIGCIPCKILPGKWIAIHDKMKKKGITDCDIVFVVHPYAYNDLLKLVKARGLSFVTIIRDKEGNFLKMNGVKNTSIINTFLLDSRKRILLVGNPFHNEKMEELYFSIINKGISTYR